MAASVPAPIAMPRSLVASAAASFTPSPTIATRTPSACSPVITSALPCGRTSAYTSSIPTWVAISWATAHESPVSRTGRIPRFLNPATASAAPGLSWSPTTIRPSNAPSRTTNTSLPSRLASPGTSMPCSASRRRDPTATGTPSSSARAPMPGRASKRSVAGASPARSTTARAMGCSEPASTAAATASSSVSSMPSVGATSSTDILPVVRVPVLSSTTACTERAFSRAWAPRMITPSSAPRPVPTSSADGVASPSAHGQAMMSTAMPAVSAKVVPAPTSSCTVKVSMDSASTVGTKNSVIRSARRWARALPV